MTQTLFPVPLGELPPDYPDRIYGAIQNWMRVYWTSLAGGATLSLFIFSYYFTMRQFHEFRKEIICLMAIPFVAHILFLGFAHHAGHGGEMVRNDSFPLVALLLIFTAGNFRKRDSFAWSFLFIGMALEFLFYLAILFDPTDMALSFFKYPLLGVLFAFYLGSVFYYIITFRKT